MGVFSCLEGRKCREKMNWGDDHFLGARDVQTLLVRWGMMCCDRWNYIGWRWSVPSILETWLSVHRSQWNRYQSRCPRTSPGWSLSTSPILVCWSLWKAALSLGSGEGVSGLQHCRLTVASWLCIPEPNFCPTIACHSALRKGGDVGKIQLPSWGTSGEERTLRDNLKRKNPPAALCSDKIINCLALPLVVNGKKRRGLELPLVVTIWHNRAPMLLCLAICRLALQCYAVVWAL